MRCSSSESGIPFPLPAPVLKASFHTCRLWTTRRPIRRGVLGHGRGPVRAPLLLAPTDQAKPAAVDQARGPDGLVAEAPAHLVHGPTGVVPALVLAQGQLPGDAGAQVRHAHA